MTAKKDDAPDNMAIWDVLSKTDPSQTKGFKRAGGFSGTAIKPMWVWQRLTEHFGPVGMGWGMREPVFQVVPGDNREVLVYCTVSGWYGGGDNGGVDVYGVGGDKVVSYIRANEQYKRPERWENDDEAFKKAYTDALMNAFKFVGVGADVHMGKFDDNKYVHQMEQEFREQAASGAGQGRGRNGAVSPTQPPFPAGPHKNITALKQAGRELYARVRSCGDQDELNAVTKENETTIAQMKEALPDWVNGGRKKNPETGEEESYEGLEQIIDRMESDFRAANEPTILDAG